MSSIIKGQRIRSESIIEIQNTSNHNAPEKGDKNLIIDNKDHEKNIEDMLNRAKSDADKIIKMAESQAVNTKNQAKVEIENESIRVLEKARKKGFEQGYQEGKKEAERIREESKVLLVKAEEERQEVFKQMEPEIIEMIIRICKKLIGEEVNFNKDTILIMIRNTLEELSSDAYNSEINIRVPIKDYDYVVEKKETIFESVADPEKLEIIKDPELEKGICIVETPFGSIETNIYKGFANLKKEMRLICSES